MQSRSFVLAALMCSLFASTGPAQELVTDLQEFGWRVGTWSAELVLQNDHEVLGKAGTKTRITSTIKWGLGKKALITTGKQEANGQSVDAMVRVLSVDPKTKAVLNHTFNDRGGIGEGRCYYRDTDSPYVWRIPFGYTEDGRAMTGLAVVKKLGPNSYSHQFVKMTINGVEADDFPVVTWHRQ